MAEQRLVEPTELAGRAAHAPTRLDLRDVPRLVVHLVDAPRHHLDPALDHRRVPVPGPVDGHDTLAVRALRVERDAEVAVVETERRGDLVPHVAVDAPAVDPLDDRTEHAPAAGGVVAGHRAGLPHRGRGDHRGERLVERDVGVVGRIARHREAAGVGEDVTDRRPLLAAAPPVEMVGDEVVEAEAPLLPELEDGHRRPRLPRRVPEHDVVGLEGPPGGRFADRGVEQHLTVARHVDLGPEVPARLAPVLEPIDDRREIRLRAFSGGHGART